MVKKYNRGASPVRNIWTGTSGYGQSSISKGGTATLRYLQEIEIKPGVKTGMLELDTGGYNRVFTEEIKNNISSKKRIWDQNSLKWFIVRDQFDKLCHLLEKHFDETLLLDFPEQQIASSAWGKLFLTKGAPLDVVRAVYKTLSLLYHPDRGGDTARMAEVNVAYKEILGELVNGD